MPFKSFSHIPDDYKFSAHKSDIREIKKFPLNLKKTKTSFPISWKWRMCLLWKTEPPQTSCGPGGMLAWTVSRIKTQADLKEQQAGASASVSRGVPGGSSPDVLYHTGPSLPPQACKGTGGSTGPQLGAMGSSQHPHQ